MGLATESQQEETAIVANAGLPEMPTTYDDDADEDWRATLRHFHLTGEGGGSANEPLRPAVLTATDSIPSPWKRYPLFYSATPGGPLKDKVRPLFEVVESTLDELSEAGEFVDIVRDNALRFVRAVSLQMAPSSGWTPFGSLVDKALERFVGEFDLSEAGQQSLSEQVEHFKGKLPMLGSVLGLDEHTTLSLWATLVLDSRRPRTAAFVDEVNHLLQRLADVLSADASHAPEALSSGALEASMGGPDIMIDAEALAMNLPELHGSVRIAKERRERIEKTEAVLKRAIEAVDSEPNLVVVHSGQIPEGFALESTRFVSDADPMTAATRIFDEQVGDMVEVLRAVRVARLDAVGAYDPELHDDALAYFDWQAFNQTELLLVPRVAVLESEERLKATSLSGFSGLLNSGRPVQILVTHQIGGGSDSSTTKTLAEYHLDLSVLSVAHREAFVIETGLSEPNDLIAGIASMSGTLRSAVAMVAEPAWKGVDAAWTLLAASREARDVHCLRYDPDAGVTWADCFEVCENPQADRPWPVHTITHLNGDGEAQSFEEALTFAHAAALDPAYRSQFKVIPPEGWIDEQVPIANYVEALAINLPMTLPYIWVVGTDGNLARAIVTRDLAFACRDRLRSWRLLQELGGIDNEYARRAAVEAREEALAEAAAEREALETAHAEAIETVRAEAAGEAMDRLVGVLMNVDQMPVAMPTSAAAAPAAAAAAPAEEAAPAPEVVEEEEEDDLSFDEPYIDTVLCTTCNECTNLNPELFKYNADKQAEIGDANAGTFAQLVTAAEKCPARCIHPGVPRSDDDTATGDMIARAQPFN